MDMLNKLCRACLTTKESFSYFLFENVNPEVYLFCTSIQIGENEDLPKALCDGCYTLLTKYTEFKRTCIQSHNTLLNCKSDVKRETQTTVLLIDKLECREQESSDENGMSQFDTSVKIEDFSDNFNEDFPPSHDVPHEIPKKKVKMRKRPKKLSKMKASTKCEPKSTKCFIYSCELCNKKFRYQERFEAHKLEHEGKRVSLHCHPCNKPFATWSGLQRHRDSAHSRRRLAGASCARCGRVCASRAARAQHERAHGARARASAACVCHVCGKRVSTAVILKAHLETHKVDRERLHTCEHCGKKFFTNTILLSHISRQHTGRRYICDFCNYPFTDKYNLAKHLLIHEGKKLYKCDLCDKSYATNGTLVEHKRIHSGERPFGCNFCAKSFVSKRRLTDHHRIHTGEKPHKCGVCEQRFTQRGTLQRHMKVHEKAVPVLQ